MLLTAAAFFSLYGYHFNRYLLPVYPPLFILFGKAVYDTMKSRAWIILVVMIVILFTKDFYKPQFKTMPFVKKDRTAVMDP
jgi:4-amino-4-deoxy-L-arabinose transferase-like glycosyltransferase